MIKVKGFALFAFTFLLSSSAYNEGYHYIKGKTTQKDPQGAFGKER
jgi:hypothetical protein